LSHPFELDDVTIRAVPPVVGDEILSNWNSQTLDGSVVAIQNVSGFAGSHAPSSGRPKYVTLFDVASVRRSLTVWLKSSGTRENVVEPDSVLLYPLTDTPYRSPLVRPALSTSVPEDILVPTYTNSSPNVVSSGPIRIVRSCSYGHANTFSNLQRPISETSSPRRSLPSS